jgi:hypothetical protein
VDYANEAARWGREARDRPGDGARRLAERDATALEQATRLARTAEAHAAEWHRRGHAPLLVSRSGAPARRSRMGTPIVGGIRFDGDGESRGPGWAVRADGALIDASLGVMSVADVARSSDATAWVRRLGE